MSQLVIMVGNRTAGGKTLARLADSLGGIRVKTFAKALPALAFCAAEDPDLVIINGDPSDLENAELIRRLRAGPSCSDVPVLVISPAGDRALRRRALEEGASDFLPAPFDLREFQVRARTLLLLRQQRRLIAVSKTLLRRQHRERGVLEERLLRVIDTVPAMIAATDRDGRYIIASSRFAALFGRRPADLIGRRPDEVRDDAFTRRLMERDARLLAGETLPTSFEEEIADDRGDPRLLLTSTSAFRAGREAMVVTATIDITERRRTEHDLIAAKELAEVANHSKTEFLANMSHELRTPLNAIIGFAQLMAGEMLGPMATPKYVGYARDIAASGEHLLGIINDILDVSKLEAGKLDLVEEPIDLAHAVRDLVRLVEQKARAGRVRIETGIEPGLPRLVADSRKVKQILLNLLSNAIKFSPPGETIEIAIRNQTGSVVIAIIDHGIGMDARELQVAVSRFGQVASAWSRKHTGTGLGLPLAIGLTEMHGGTLSIRSSKEIGTTATVTFPRERSQFPSETIAIEAAS